MTQIIESIQSIQNIDSIYVKSFKYSNMKAVLLERHSQAIFGEQNRKKGNTQFEMGNNAISCGILKHNKTMPIIEKLLIATYPSEL